MANKVQDAVDPSKRDSSLKPEASRIICTPYLPRRSAAQGRWSCRPIALARDSFPSAMAVAKKAKKDNSKAFEDHTVDELRELWKAADDSKDVHVVCDVEANRIKAAMCKQLVNQMLLPKELSEKEAERLEKEGREISAIVPNVTQDMMDELGLDKVDDKGNLRGKVADLWFGTAPARALSSGHHLHLKGNIHFRYVKAQRELRLNAVYKFSKKPPKPKAKPRSGGRKRKELGDGELGVPPPEGAGGEGDNETGGEDGEDGGSGAEEEEEEAEASPEPTAARSPVPAIARSPCVGAPSPPAGKGGPSPGTIAASELLD